MILLILLMLAIGVAMLQAAKKTKQDSLYIICIIWSAISVAIILFAPVSGIDFGGSFISLGIAIADIAVLITAFSIRLKDETQENTKRWEIAQTILLVSVGVLFCFFLLYKAYIAAIPR